MYSQFNRTLNIENSQRILTGISILFINLIGISINSYTCSAFMFGIRYRVNFYVLSISKTVGNVAFGIISIIWMAPASLLFLMAIFNRDVQPECLVKRRMHKKSSIISVGDLMRAN
ncbi:unnamed protein product [Caenorhabditis bovis]|uniref:7TM GPCR serpentine receptor class x (Srx) domain-containing protein n=1 Tax=Caenorhabditis bovis TaxID=2654633 RepID=A0A8S1EUS7_9PELO|nr:unnamed protein product [Caenorhabditis bovis]